MLWPTLGGDVSRGSDSEQLGHSGTVSEALYFIAAAPAASQGNVIGLMDALRRSVKTERKQPARR
jgi:hypothetical protein